MLKNDGGWRKNFRRVKQQMDQNLGRSEKSEVLSEDLVILEKRVECIKHTCHNTVKKVSAMVPNTGNDSEKRLKKLPEWSLHTSMEESSNMLGAESLLGKMYHLCGDVESSLAKERQDMEYAIENCLIQPFHQILEHDIPTVTKLRKQLSKLVLDMDHAKNRYHSVSRQSQAAGHTKIDSIKDEYEDSQIRVDQARDQLATEMYSFVSKEAEYSHMLMKLLEVQANYHQQALELIKSSLPEMEKQLEKSTQMPMFGQDLLDHLRRADRDIAVVLEVCICSLIEFGLDEEGLFRVAGPAPKLKKLKASFDSGSTIDMADYDVHCVTGALKQYLRELPEPLLTYSLYDKWIQAVHLPQEQRLQELWRVLDVLPQPNYNNLRYLIKFLAKVADKADVNKMSPSNLAIVIGPNLLWPEGDVGPSMLTTGSQSAIVEAMVTHADWFFPGAVDFHKTAKGLATPPPEDRCMLWLASEELQRVTLKRKNSTASMGSTDSKSSVAVQKSNKKSIDSNSRSESLDSCDDLLSISRQGSQKSKTSLPNTAMCAITEQREPSPSTRSEPDYNIDTMSEPGTLPRRSRKPYLNVTHYQRATTPPPKPPPPRSFHSDVYSTVFALQSLGDPGWSDYLTRVRNMWDGHMNHGGSQTSPTTDSSTASNQSISSIPAQNRGCNGLGNGDVGDLEYASTSSLASGPNPLILPLQGETGSNEAPPSYATQVPQPAPVQQTAAPGHPAPPAHPADPVMTSPHTSPHMYPAQPPSQPNNVGLHSPSQEGLAASPKTVKRIAKKPAPPPPAERPHLPSGPPPPIAEKPSPTSEKPLLSPLEKPSHLTADRSATSPGADAPKVVVIPSTPLPVLDKPPVPERPQVPPPAPPVDASPTSPRPRPTGPRPEKPPPPGKTHQRSGSTGARPARPQPPPPPPPKDQSDEVDHPDGTATQKEAPLAVSEEGFEEEMEQTHL